MPAVAPTEQAAAKHEASRQVNSNRNPTLLSLKSAPHSQLAVELGARFPRATESSAMVHGLVQDLHL